MTVLETFRMLIEGEVVGSRYVAAHGAAPVRTKDVSRTAHRVAAAVEAGTV